MNTFLSDWSWRFSILFIALVTLSFIDIGKRGAWKVHHLLWQYCDHFYRPLRTFVILIRPSSILHSIFRSSRPYVLFEEKINKVRNVFFRILNCNLVSKIFYSKCEMEFFICKSNLIFDMVALLFEMYKSAVWILFPLFCLSDKGKFSFLHCV